MKLAELSQSTLGRVAIGFALFAAGWYFPPFHFGSATKAQEPQTTASAAASGTAGAQRQR